MAEIVENRKKAGKNKILSNSEYCGMLINAPFPEVSASREDSDVEKRFDVLKDLIGKVRALRTECGLDPASKINIAVLIEKGSAAEVCREKVDMIQLLAGVAQTEFVEAKPAAAIGTVGTGFEAFILVDETINREQLLVRFQKALETEEGWVRRSESKLNGSFAQHAPAELVAEERAKMEESRRKIEKLRSYIESL